MRIQGTLILGLLFFAVPFAHGQVRTTVRVLPETVLNGDTIQLGDIARFTGDAVKTLRLKEISLGTTPSVGMTRDISREQIALTIAAAGFAENEITLDSPLKVSVKRASQQISANQIREAIEKALIGPLAAQKISARIVRLNVPENLIAPLGALQIRAMPNPVRDWASEFLVPTEILVDQKKIRSFAATVEIEASADVYVANKDLSANANVQLSDLTIERRRLLKPITTYYREPEKLRGLKLTRNIPVGTELTSDACIPRNIVSAGDPVRVEARSGAIKIVLMAEARSSGKIGDRIAVKNIQSGQMLQAVITDEGQVRVIF